MTRRACLAAATLLVAAVAATGCGNSDSETTSVRAYPSPGTPSASPQTAIALVGLDEDDANGISVTGSKSGKHQGTVNPLGSSTEGISFKPDQPFAPQETVTVDFDGEVAGSETDDGYSFKTASFRTDASLPPKVLPPESRTIRHESFHSRPDLKPPVIDIDHPATGKVGDGLLFISPKVDGPMIFDDQGDLVYFKPSTEAADFRTQTYQGKPVLTWWEGPFNAGGYTEGTNIIADRHYRELTRVLAGNGYQADLHEFNLTDRGTAFVTAYKSVLVDLSPWGGPKRGAVLDSIAQEIDIKTGEVVWEWHSLGNVGLGETNIAFPQSPTEAFDYFHINSINEDDDGNIIISGRNTFSVLKIDKATGKTIWQLGGKKSDFKMGEGTNFSWQHDALRQPDGTLTIYDNAANYFGKPTYDHSRGLVLDLDMENMTAELADAPYVHPDRLLAPSQGNLQELPNGNRVVGWGSQPWFTEFTPDGEVQLNGTYYARNSSYRTYRDPWEGQPSDDPAIATAPAPDGKVKVWMSWNGATEVDSWRVLAGDSESSLKPVDEAGREGFETAVTTDGDAGFFAAEALDKDGNPLGRSATVTVGEQAGPG
jgi:hypothetical protein